MSELRIAVLVKQVPDPALVEISEDGRLMRENVPAMIDPFGKMALQHAVALKCQRHIDAVSMGPMQAQDVLRKSLEFGADDAYLISGREFAGADTIATARTMSAFLSKRDYDIVFCGMQATDGDTAQVPSELAVFLKANIYSYVSSIDIDNMTVTQNYENSTVVSRIALPAVITFMRPPEGCIQIPSMTDYVSASDKEIKVMGIDDLGISVYATGAHGSRTKVSSVATVMRKKKDTIFIDGSDTVSAAEAILKEARR